DNEDVRLKYASQVAGINNYYKNRKGMLNSYANSDFLARKTKEHEELKAWVHADATRNKEFSADIAQVEQLITARDAQEKRDFYLKYAMPRFLANTRTLYRLAIESAKPDVDRKAGYQTRDLPRIKASLAAIERNYDEKVDKALTLNGLRHYVAQAASERDAGFDAALGIHDGMSETDLKNLLDKLYANSKFAEKSARSAWLTSQPKDFQASNDSFIKAAVAMYDSDLKKEAANDELAGKIQQSYANYMKAKIAFMHSKGQFVYPDANSTLRVTFGKVAGRDHGVDGTTWKAFTTIDGIPPKATGSGEFNAPAAQLAAIKSRVYGKYADPVLKTVPVAFLATLDITGGNSGSAALNSKGELVGLAFDGTLDSIISDWDFNKANTRDIQVDLRYILWEMQYVDKADNLLKEMGAE
ncbi:MAG: S46 family peptidase, partial [Burkholderiales bacterium]|nr:S46 family peptidase [Burkholderiales bacterium]